MGASGILQAAGEHEADEGGGGGGRDVEAVGGAGEIDGVEIEGIELGKGEERPRLVSGSFLV